MKVFAPKTAYRAKQDGTWDDLAHEIQALADMEAVDAWEGDFVTRRYRTLPENWQETILEAIGDRRTGLLNDAFDNAFRDTVGAPGNLTSPRRTAP